MVAKTRKTRSPRNARATRATPLKNLKPAAAFAKARSTARKAFDTLVKQGAAFGAASKEAAIDRAGAARDAAVARAEEARARTVEVVSHLEKVFEQRVSRAISKLGVPTSKDVRELSRQVAQLQASVDRLGRSRSRASA
jgi:poly(hydroxyalkanoate) granule-associated protein